MRQPQKWPRKSVDTEVAQTFFGVREIGLDSQRHARAVFVFWYDMVGIGKE